MKLLVVTYEKLLSFLLGFVQYTHPDYLSLSAYTLVLNPNYLFVSSIKLTPLSKLGCKRARVDDPYK